MTWKTFYRKGVIEARPHEPGGDLSGISLSTSDMVADNHLKPGGMIARNPANPDDQWFINKGYFKAHYYPASEAETQQEEESMDQSEESFGFDRALQRLHHGKLVARNGWNGKGMFIYLVRGSEFVVNRPPLDQIYPAGTEIKYLSHIDMRTADGSCVPWLASQTDILARDWCEVTA